MTGVNEEHVINEIPAYELGILETQEAALVVKHLESCTSCYIEWQAYRRLTASLASLIPPVDPPRHVKAQLISRTVHKAVRQTFLQTLQRLIFSPGSAVRIAVVIFILTLFFSNILLWNRVNTLSHLQASGFSSLALSGTPANPHAEGMIVYTAGGEYGLLVVNQLKELPPDFQYQLWLIRDGIRTSGGVFSVGKDGYAVLRIESPDLLTHYEGFGVTIEPAGGSVGPTGERVLAGQF